MPRKCTNFIDDYMKYTAQNEAPSSYHQWSLLSVIAAAVRRQVWVDMGFNVTYPNLFVILVGPPGKCRKTSAMKLATKLLEDLSDVKISADSATRQALSRQMSECQTSCEINNQMYNHSSLTVISKELSVFLGDSDKDLLNFLTDMYDNPDSWEYRTKNKGIDTLVNCWFNLLGATTPKWLMSNTALQGIEGGFTSRAIFVVEENTRHKIARYHITPEERLLKELLKADIEQISMMKGEIAFEPEAAAFYDAWYELHHGKTLDEAGTFWGYEERKHAHMVKVAMLLSIAESDRRIITSAHLQTALWMLEQLESKMIRAFGGAGRSRHAPDINKIAMVIADSGVITRNNLKKLTWTDVDLDVFDKVIVSLLEMGYIKMIKIGDEDGYEFCGK